MGGINVPRWLAGGFVAGIAMFVVMLAATPLVLERSKALLEPKGLELSLADWPAFLVLSLLVGLLLVFLYAAARPRFGAGPKTAIIVGIAGWLFGPVLGSAWLATLGFAVETPLLATALVADLIGLVTASLIGASIYREGATVPAAHPAAA